MAGNGFSSNRAYSLWKAFEDAVLNRNRKQYELYHAYAEVVRKDNKLSHNIYEGELIP